MIDEIVDSVLFHMKEKLGDEMEIQDQYPLESIRVTKPLLYTECVGFDRSDVQPASGLFSIDANFETRICFPVSRRALERKKARRMATKVALMIEGNSFGQNRCYPARLKSAYDDGLDPDAPTVETWSITWEMQIFLGEQSLQEDLFSKASEKEFDTKDEVTRDRS